MLIFSSKHYGPIQKRIKVSARLKYITTMIGQKCYGFIIFFFRRIHLRRGNTVHFKYHSTLTNILRTKSEIQLEHGTIQEEKILQLFLIH